MTQPIAEPAAAGKETLLQNEIGELRRQLQEAQEVLNAIRNGEVDAIIVNAPLGEKIFSITSAETPYRILIEEMNEGALILNVDGTVLYANNRISELLHLPIESIVGEDFRKWLPNGDKQAFEANLSQSLTSKFSVPLSYKIGEKKQLFLLFSFSPLPEDMLGDICITVSDLTAIKEKEYEILETGVRLAEQAEQLAKTNEELTASRKAIMNMMKDTLESKNKVEDSNKDLLKEVEERKTAEDHLRNSEEFIRRVIESSKDCICVLDLEGNLLSMNEGGIEALEISSIETYLHQPWLGLWFGKGLRAAAEATAKAKTGSTEKFTAYSKTEKGNAKWWEVILSPVKNADGKLERLLAIARDNTQRFEAETALVRSETNLRAIFENASTGFLLIDKNFQVVEFNTLFQEYSKYAWNKTMHKKDKLFDLMPPEGKQPFLELYISKLSQGIPVRSQLKYEIEQKTEVFTLGMNPVNDSAGQFAGTCVTCEKITERVQAEEELIQSETRYRTLFETMDQGFCVVELLYDTAGNPLDYRYVEANRAFELQTGLKDLLGKTALETLPGLNGKSIEHYARVALTGLPLRYELDEPHLNACFDVYAFKIGSAESKKVGVLLNNITDKKKADEKLKQSEKRFRELIESLPQLFWTCTADGPCDYLSRQWVEYTGIPEKDQLGYGWLQQLHPADRENVVKDWQKKVLKQEAFDTEFRIKKHTGEYNWFRTRAVPLFDEAGKLSKWFGSNTNFNDVKKAEEEIRKLNTGLEEKVKERTVQLQAANKELEAFSYSVSHDLRAPLRALNSYAQILQEDYGNKIEADGKKILEQIRLNTRKMGMLIDELLAFSRLGRKEMVSFEINMNDLVAAVVEDLERNRPHSASITVSPMPAVRADYSLIYQVMYNLLDNAVKYSSKKDQPRIEVFAQLQDNNDVFVVKDNGVGFDMRHAGKLFGVFQRLHTETEFEGIGVGLAIVKRIISKHGGSIWVEAKENEGAAFYFTLK